MKLKLIAITTGLMLASGISFADNLVWEKGSYGKANWHESSVHETKTHAHCSHAYGIDQFEKHQARLHNILQLSAAQESAWQAFQAQIKPEDKPEHPDFAELSQLNTLQRLDKLEAWDKERNKKFNQRNSAVRTFYAQLNDAQKKVFDEHALPPVHRHHELQHGEGS